MQALMDAHHGNNFARDFLADDGMAEVLSGSNIDEQSIFAGVLVTSHLRAVQSEAATLPHTELSSHNRC